MHLWDWVASAAPAAAVAAYPGKATRISREGLIKCHEKEKKYIYKRHLNTQTPSQSKKKKNWTGQRTSALDRHGGLVAKASAS